MNHCGLGALRKGPGLEHQLVTKNSRTSPYCASLHVNIKVGACSALWQNSGSLVLKTRARERDEALKEIP